MCPGTIDTSLCILIYALLNLSVIDIIIPISKNRNMRLKECCCCFNCLRKYSMSVDELELVARTGFQGAERVVIDSKEPRRRSLAAHSHQTTSPPLSHLFFWAWKYSPFSPSYQSPLSFQRSVIKIERNWTAVACMTDTGYTVKSLGLDDSFLSVEQSYYDTGWRWRVGPSASAGELLHTWYFISKFFRIYYSHCLYFVTSDLLLLLTSWPLVSPSTFTALELLRWYKESFQALRL